MEIKFRKFKVGESEILMGKDSKQNDELVKQFKGEKNKIIHTVAPGSPFCVINDLKPSAITIYLSGACCAAYSQDWRDNKKNTKINIFTGKDVNKTFGMKTGTWKVKNSKTRIIKKEDILKIKKNGKNRTSPTR